MNLVISKSKLISNLLFTAFWIAGLFSFITQEFAISVYEKLSSPVFAGVDFILIILGVWSLRSRTDLIVTSSLLIISFISTCIFNDMSILQYLNGLRVYIAFIFIIPIIRYFFEDKERRKAFIKKIDKHLYIFLWLQVPSMILQCFLYGAYDKVGGTLGWLNSGAITTMIYFTSFYLMLKRWDKTKSYFQNIKANWILVFLLFPSYLNETKIAFVFLAMYFFFLIPMDRKFIKRLTIVLPIMVVALAGAGYLYITLVDTGGDDIFSAEYIDIYLNGDDELVELVEYIVENDVTDVQEKDYARGLKFAVLPLILERSPHATNIGYGIGLYKGGKIFEKTEFSKHYNWLLQGTIMQAFLWMVELGWSGLIWYIMFWFVYFRFFSKCHRNAQLQFYLLLTVILISLYNPVFCLVPVYIVFMYLLYISSRWNLIEDENASQSQITTN